MKKLITIILILISIHSIGQITNASYTNKGATVPFINSSLYKLNGVSIAPKLYYQKSIDTLNKNLSTGLLKLTTGTGKLSIITDNSTNWNTAYGWGNHANLYKGKADSVNLSGYATQYDLTQHSSSQWTTSVSDIYYNSGNVGIGTNTPAYKLQVDGITLLQMPLNTSNAFRLEGEDKYITCNTGSAGKTIIFDEAGLGLKVGINTTPTTTLGINGTSLFMMPENTTSAFRITGPVSEDDYLSFHTGTAGKIILFDETNIGVKIGISKTPAYKLDVKGAINVDSLYVGGVKKNTVWDEKEGSLGNPSINGYVLSSLADGTRSWVAQTGGSSQWTTIGTSVQFPNNTNNYYVGLGTYTTTISAPLHLYFDEPKIRVQERTNNHYWDIITEAGTGDFRIYTPSYPSALHLERSNGFIGIGKDPSFKLDVDGTVRTQLIRTDTIRVDAANELNVIGGFDNTLPVNKKFSIYSIQSADTLVRVFNDKVLLGSQVYGANIGINNDNPVYSLDVIGASKVNGNFVCTNSVRVGNDANAASSTNVGAIRYRVSGNNSYCEMVMQTGASTYAWVVIKTNTW